MIVDFYHLAQQLKLHNAWKDFVQGPEETFAIKKSEQLLWKFQGIKKF